MGLTVTETGPGSKSSGLEVEHTLLVAMRRYFAVVARLEVMGAPLRDGMRCCGQLLDAFAKRPAGENEVFN